MIITQMDTILACSRYLFVRIHTDEGLVGIGECGAWGYQQATAAAVHQMEKVLIGQNPLRIEHIWNSLTRNLHFRGAVIQAAVSGIDIGLWDLKGKYFGVPCYELMGGKCREKIKIYVNVFGKTDAETVASAVKLKQQGFKAIRFYVMHPDNGENQASLVQRTEKTMQALREAVGWEMDIAVECHRGMRPAEAIALGQALKPYRPYFYEDPIPDNAQAMPKVIRQCGIPVATGERFIHTNEFAQLLNSTEAAFLRPDMCVAGGLTAGKKIAAFAEIMGAYLIPHNPLGPISTAACLQLDACIPNFEIQEYPMFDGECDLDREMKEPFQVQDGYLQLPDKPGLGVELIDRIEEVFPFTGVYGPADLLADGSVADR
jgi:galactonate dehydratase